MRLRRLLLAFSLIVVATPAAPGLAHPAPFSYIDLQISQAGVEAAIVMHAFDVAHDLGLSSQDRVFDPGFPTTSGDAITSLVLSRLSLRFDGRAVAPVPVDVTTLSDRQSVRVRLRYPVTRFGVVRVDTSMFPYDAAHQTFLNVYDKGQLTQQVILDRTRTTAEHYSGSLQGTLAGVSRFVVAGIQHIAIGPDHILFLIGLLLLGGSITQLLKIVTAFTIAHSITLTFAVLTLLSPSARLVEPAIALSIIYVGVDNLMVRPGSRDTRVWIALAFGLIHGFGFASVLRELDLPARALGWSLFSFNAGVEIGQIFIVASVAAALAWIAAHSAELNRRIAFGGSATVAAAGLFWFVERVFFAGGA